MMKKLALTIAIVLGVTAGAMAQGFASGVFQRGTAVEDPNDASTLFSNNRTASVLPGMPAHNVDANQNADSTPLGSGIVVLAALGGAYLVGKRRKED